MPDYDLGTARGKIDIDSSGAVKGVASAETAVHGLGKSSASTSTALLATGGALTAVGAAAVGGFALAINAAANFEQGLSKIKAVSGATDDQMELLRKKALKLGADTVFSAGEAASAMEELVKAGLSVDDTLNGAADAAVALAAAGEISLPEAAEIASAAMNNFNLAAEAMPNVADKIAGAANASAISVSDFGQSMKQAGAVSALVGLSFDDMALAITAMGNAGIKGSDAGTSLKTFLQNLQPGTIKQTDLFKDLGLITKEAGNRFFDAAGHVKSMAEISDVLGGALEGMTDQQKSMALETLFGSDAIRAAAIVAKEGSTGFNELGIAMGKVSAEEVAATKMDNLKGSIEQLKGSFETLMIVIGTPFLGAVRNVIDTLTELVNKFTAMDPHMQKLISMFTLGGGAITGFVGVLLTVGGAILKVRQIIQGLQLASLFTNPVFFVIAAVAALAAGLFILYQRSETFRDIVDRIGHSLLEFFGPAIDAVRGFIDNLVLSVSQGWNAIKDGTDPLVAVATTIDKIFGGHGQIAGIISAFSIYIENTWNKITEFTKEIWPQISEAVGHVMNVIHDIVGIVLDVVMALWRAFGDDILHIVKAAFEYVKETIENAIKIIQNIIRLVLAIINGDWGKAWDAIKNIVSTVWNQIFTEIDFAISVIKSILGGVVDVLGGIWHAVWDWFYDTVVEKVIKLIGYIQDLPGKLITALGDIVEKFTQIGRDIINGMVNGIKDMIGGAIDTVEGFAGDIAGSVTGFFGIGSPSRLFFEFGQNTIQGFINGLRDEEGNLTQTVEDIVGGAVQGVSTLLSGISGLRSNASARTDVADAEKELYELALRNNALPDEIAAAEARLAAARKRAREVTLDEEAKILDAKKALADAEANASDVKQESGRSSDAYRRAVIAVEQAEKALAATQRDATAPSGDRVNDLTERLNLLRTEQKGMTEALRTAEENLNTAKENALVAEARLIESGQAILGLGQESHDMFRELAQRVGFTADEVDGLVGQYSALAAAIRDSTQAAKEAAWYAAASRNAGTATSTKAVSAQAKSLSAQANSVTTYNIENITIPAKDLKEMKDVQDFFGRVKQVARQGT